MRISINLAVLFVLSAACAGESLNEVGSLDSAGAGGGSGSGGAGSGVGGSGDAGGSSMAGKGGGAAEVGGAAGTGGKSAAGGSGNGTGEAGTGSTGGIPCDEGNGCLLHQGIDIRALAANESEVFWVAYGSFDNLDNYSNTGEIWARSHETGGVRRLAMNLPGPIGVAVTTTHAYAYVDRFWESGSERIALLRVPLESDSVDAEVVQVDTSPRGRYGKAVTSGKMLVSYLDLAYWTFDLRVDTISAEATEPTRFLDAGEKAGWLSASPLTADESHLYYLAGIDSEISEIWRRPHDQGEVEPIADSGNVTHIRSHGENLYAVATGEGYDLSTEFPGTHHLLRMPKTGGPWTRLTERPGTGGYLLEIVGSRYFYDNYPEAGTINIEVLQGTLDDPDNAEPLLSLPEDPPSWVGSDIGVFWTDGEGIYLRYNVN